MAVWGELDDRDSSERQLDLLAEAKSWKNDGRGIRCDNAEADAWSGDVERFSH